MQAGGRMHKHERIRERMLAEVAELPPDTRLPDERELAERFEVSRATVRQALAALASEARIYSVRGRGTFVASPHIAKGLRLHSFSEDMRDRGLRPSTRLLLAEEAIADDEVASMLELEPGAPVVHLDRLRLADGFPMCLESIWLPAGMVPGILREDLTGSLYTLLADRFRIEIGRADERIEAVVVDGDARELLAMPDPSAALVVARRSFDRRGRTAEYGRSVYRADRYSFDVSITR